MTEDTPIPDGQDVKRRREVTKHTHDGDCKRDVICPSCGGQGFDGRGEVSVQGTRMYLRGCWSCGLTFATETDDPRDDGRAEDPEVLMLSTLRSLGNSGAESYQEDGAPVEALLDGVAESVGRAAAEDALETLKRKGEVYVPTEGRVKRT